MVKWCWEEGFKAERQVHLDRPSRAMASDWNTQNTTNLLMQRYTVRVRKQERIAAIVGQLWQSCGSPGAVQWSSSCSAGSGRSPVVPSQQSLGGHALRTVTSR